LVNEDKNNAECISCDDRLKYVAELDGLSVSVPIHLTDLGHNISPHNTAAPPKTASPDPDQEACRKCGGPLYCRGLCRKCYQKEYYRKRKGLSADAKLNPGGKGKKRKPKLKDCEPEPPVIMESSDSKPANIFEDLNQLVEKHGITLDRLIFILLREALK